MSFFRVRSREEDGAALLEFALLLPFLLVLVLGIAEFGHALSRQLDVRHGAREGSRQAAVSDATLAGVCDSMTFANGVTVDIVYGADVGDPVTTTVVGPAISLTGFFNWAGGWPFPLVSEVESRMEQPPGAGVNGTCP